MPDAFKHQDQTTVPLVWQHGHNEPSNVLGYATLEHREDGVYAYGFFNETDAGKECQDSSTSMEISSRCPSMLISLLRKPSKFFMDLFVS